uniref:Uncharacterized protein n=1 Tax=Strombidium inclinatum TaxID=197538 RepID=A0A7S3IXJ4_9SPIT
MGLLMLDREELGASSLVARHLVLHPWHPLVDSFLALRIITSPHLTFLVLLLLLATQVLSYEGGHLVLEYDLGHVTKVAVPHFVEVELQLMNVNWNLFVLDFL